MKVYVFLYILLVVGLVGCKSSTEYVNVTHTINNTIYLTEEVEVVKYVNITEPCVCNNTMDVDYVLRLIRELKGCEAREIRD